MRSVVFIEANWKKMSVAVFEILRVSDKPELILVTACMREVMSEAATDPALAKKSALPWAVMEDSCIKMELLEEMAI